MTSWTRACSKLGAKALPGPLMMSAFVVIPIPSRSASRPICVLATARRCGFPAISDLLWDHLDRAGRALLHADPTALAVVEIELVAVSAARIELHHRVVGTDAVAVVTAEAVTTRH